METGLQKSSMETKETVEGTVVMRRTMTFVAVNSSAPQPSSFCFQSPPKNFDSLAFILWGEWPPTYPTKFKKLIKNK